MRHAAEPGWSAQVRFGHAVGRDRAMTEGDLAPGGVERDVRMTHVGCQSVLQLDARRHPAFQLLAAGEAETRLGRVGVHVLQVAVVRILPAVRSAAVHADNGAVDVAGRRELHRLSGQRQSQGAGDGNCNQLSFHWDFPGLIDVLTKELPSRQTPECFAKPPVTSRRWREFGKGRTEPQRHATILRHGEAICCIRATNRPESSCGSPDPDSARDARPLCRARARAGRATRAGRARGRSIGWCASGSPRGPSPVLRRRLSRAPHRGMGCDSMARRR